MMEDNILLFIRRKDATDQYVNDLTKFMDENVSFNTHPDFCVTYMIKHSEGTMCIRFPGSTRGHVSYDDNNIITDIVLYEDTCFDRVKCNDIRYQKKVKYNIMKFIGYKIIIDNSKTSDTPHPKGCKM